MGDAREQCLVDRGSAWKDVVRVRSSDLMGLVEYQVFAV